MVAFAQPKSRSNSPGIALSRGRPRPRIGKYPYPRLSPARLGLRFYSPGIGKWISRDPIEEEGGLHLYRFVENDPVAKRDKLGLLIESLTYIRTGDEHAGIERYLLGWRSRWSDYVSDNEQIMAPFGGSISRSWGSAEIDASGVVGWGPSLSFNTYIGLMTHVSSLPSGTAYLNPSAGLRCKFVVKGCCASGSIDVNWTAEAEGFWHSDFKGWAKIGLTAADVEAVHPATTISRAMPTFSVSGVLSVPIPRYYGDAEFNLDLTVSWRTDPGDTPQRLTGHSTVYGSVYCTGQSYY